MVNGARSALWIAITAAASFGAIGGCAHDGPDTSMPSARSVLAQQLSARMPTPGRARMDAALQANEACVSCHPQVAAEWRGSLHQRADIEPAYQRSFAIEPLPFCRSCHAPEAVVEQEEPEAIAHLGVGCVTCHVTGADMNQVLAAPSQRPALLEAPHGVLRSSQFAGVGACEACHQFRFPVPHGRGPESFMQSTILEHAASPASARSCASCHMPPTRDGRRSHAFVASRDPEFVRSAVSIHAVRVDDQRVEITLTPRDPGHAFPTGDLFRRVEVWAEVAGPDDMSLGSASRYLTRHWTFRPGQIARILSGDDRLRSAPVTVTLDVGPAGRDHDIVWRVAYQRVAHPNGISASSAEIEGEVVLGSGRFGPDPGSAEKVKN